MTIILNELNQRHLSIHHLADSIKYSPVPAYLQGNKIPKFVFILIATMIVISSCAKLSFASGWEEVEGSNDIVIYQKKFSDSDMMAFKGVTRIDADVDTIIRFISDNSVADKWIPMVGEKRTVNELSPHSRIEYTHVEMPWPLTDRYFITLVTAEQYRDGVIKVSMKSVENPPFIESGKIMGVFGKSHIWLEPIENGHRTRMTVEIQTDPKGLIPKWLVNKMQAKAPIDFFTNLSVELKNQKLDR